MASEEDDDIGEPSSTVDELVSLKFVETAMYNPTTPAVKKVSKPSKANGRPAVAGPSSKPMLSGVVSAREDVSDESAAELEAVQQRNRSKPKRAASREPHNTSRSRTAQRVKGKGKARSPSPVDVDMVVDEMVEMEGKESEIAQATTFVLNHTRARDVEKSASWKKREDRHRRELERLQSQLKDVSCHISTL